MKRQTRKDQSDDSIKDFMDASGLMGEDLPEGVEESHPAEALLRSKPKGRLNELRRRHEERLERKRIALEYGWDWKDDGDLQ